MTRKKKLLIAGLLLVVAVAFFLSHFWSCTVFALQKAVALGIVPPLVLSKFVAGIASIAFLL